MNNSNTLSPRGELGGVNQTPMAIHMESSEMRGVGELRLTKTP